MNRRQPLSRLLALLCLTALLGAQVFGLARGYRCDCAGLAVWTAQDHCHGPHGSDCHQDAVSDTGHHENDGAEDRRDHEQVRDEVQSRLSLSIEAPVLVPVPVVFLGGEATWSARILPTGLVIALDKGTGPPWGVTIARTTVLLI